MTMLGLLRGLCPIVVPDGALPRYGGTVMSLHRVDGWDGSRGD
jgi:hypothetical protein